MKTQILPLCSWHDSRQVVLPGFVASHGICPVCAWRNFGEQLAMKHDLPEWPRILREYPWRLVPSGDYWGVLQLESGANVWTVTHKGVVTGFECACNKKVVFRGLLTDCLEYAINH